MGAIFFYEDMIEISESEARKIIWESFATGLISEKAQEIKKEVKRRKNAVHKQLADMNRIEYFNLFNAMIRESFYRVVDQTAMVEDLRFLQFMGFGTTQWSDDSYNIMANNSICGNLCLYCYITGIFNHYNWFDAKQIVDENAVFKIKK